VTFVFSNCDAGVTFQAPITNWLRDASGNQSDPIGLGAWSWVGDKWTAVVTSACIVKARKEAEELYEEALQELKKLEPTADTISLLKDLWETAKGEITGPLGILQHMMQQRADDATKSWGDRCVPADSPTHCGQ
jgi:hypothetical protein